MKTWFRITALFFSLLAAMNVSADCYAMNLEGQSTLQDVDFQISDDDIREEKSIVELSGR